MPETTRPPGFRSAPPAPGERPEHRLARLRLRSMRRGIREMDLILSAFADRHLAGLAPEGLATYEALLDESDHDILAWITGAAPPPQVHAPLVARLREAGLALGRDHAAGR